MSFFFSYLLHILILSKFSDTATDSRDTMNKTKNVLFECNLAGVEPAKRISNQQEILLSISKNEKVLEATQAKWTTKFFTSNSSFKIFIFSLREDINKDGREKWIFSWIFQKVEMWENWNLINKFEEKLNKKWIKKNYFKGKIIKNLLKREFVVKCVNYDEVWT